MRPIYLDSHASTPIDPRVLQVMHEALESAYGNPHSDDHFFGWTAGSRVDIARKQIAELIGADSDEIIFTSGATEANNLALLGFARGAVSERSVNKKSRNHIIVSAIEHKCVLGAATVLEQDGWKMSILPVNRNGVVDLQELSHMISAETALVSIMAVNNEIGTIQPINSVANICHNHGAVLHTDAAQAPLATEIDVVEQEIDLLSLSAHKMHGPKGIGALYIKRELQSKIVPLMFGGGQQLGIRPGTLPTPLCAGFGYAAELVTNSDRKAQWTKTSNLRNNLLERLQIEIPECCLNGNLSDRHPGNLNVRFTGIDASRLIGKLQPNIAISTGSACTTGIPEPSHVLTAIGLSLNQAEESIRIGLDRFTNESELETATSMITAAAKECYTSVA